MGSGFELAASYFKKNQAKLTWAEAITTSQETGTHNIIILASPYPFDAVPFLDDILRHIGRLRAARLMYWPR